MLIQRRNLLRGMFAMPAIVMIDNIMPVKLFDISNRPVYAMVPESVWILPFQIEKIRVTAKSRVLDAKWTIEESQPLISHVSIEAYEMVYNQIKNSMPL